MKQSTHPRALTCVFTKSIWPGFFTFYNSFSTLDNNYFPKNRTISVLIGGSGEADKAPKFRLQNILPSTILWE